jgi:hypothetical protein
MDRLMEVAAPLGARAYHLDVTDPASVKAFCARIPACSLLVNNAGGALGRDFVADAIEEQWRWMYEANVLGVMRMTRELLPKLLASGDGHVVIVASIASFETYEGGAGYCAAKHGARALARTLRLELLGQPVRVTEIDPGMVETEFSLVRFDWDGEKARAVYEGATPLSADDVADAIAWTATRPSHVNIDELVIRPRDQATADRVFRAPPE